MNCGVFAVTYTYHAARGYDVSKLKFDESLTLTFEILPKSAVIDTFITLQSDSP